MPSLLIHSSSTCTKMVGGALFLAFVLLNAVVAVPPKHDRNEQLQLSLVADGLQTANASLVENFLEPPSFTIPAELNVPARGYNPHQWPMPGVLRRQTVCSNYCGPTQSAPNNYCYCGQQCCGSTKCCITASGQQCCGDSGCCASGQACCAGKVCCNTAAGSLCCGTASSCCINGATCNGNQVCEFKTTVVSVIATSTRVVYNDITQTVTAVGGTVTVTSTLNSVSIVTISSADVATIFSFATVTMAARKLARDLRPADTVEQPLKSSTSAIYVQDIPPSMVNLAPEITQFPSSPDHLEKRQTNFISTITSTISIVTIVSTSNRLTTTTVSARTTATASTTIWQTVTSVINAKRTTTATSTLTLTPGFIPNNVATTTSASGGGGGSNNGGSNDTPTQAPSNKGLSTGAQAGIGAGTAGGSLIICIILGFFFWRRRKTRKERNQEMIDSAVTSAMAAQQSRNSQPTSHYYDGKQLSTATASVPSPQPYSPTPPLHSPQPTYVYPPPAGHSPQQPIYNNQGPMEFSESGMEPRVQYGYSAPLYGGSEADGIPVQRYELQQFSSPAPVRAETYGDVPHPGAYASSSQQDRDRIQRGYSDLPEVRVYDLPEVRVSDLPEVRR